MAQNHFTWKTPIAAPYFGALRGLLDSFGALFSLFFLPNIVIPRYGSEVFFFLLFSERSPWTERPLIKAATRVKVVHHPLSPRLSLVLSRHR